MLYAFVLTSFGNMLGPFICMRFVSNGFVLDFVVFVFDRFQAFKNKQECSVFACLTLSFSFLKYLCQFIYRGMYAVCTFIFPFSRNLLMWNSRTFLLFHISFLFLTILFADFEFYCSLFFFIPTVFFVHQTRFLSRKMISFVTFWVMRFWM